MTGKNIPGDIGTDQIPPGNCLWYYDGRTRAHAITLPFPLFRVFSVLFSPHRCYAGGSLLAERRPRRSRERSRAALSRGELALPTLLSSSSSSSSSSWSFAVLDVVVDEEFHPGVLQARPKLRLVNALGLHRNHPRARAYTRTYARTRTRAECLSPMLRGSDSAAGGISPSIYCCVCVWFATSSKYPFGLLSRDAKSRRCRRSRVCVRSDLTRLSRPAVVGAGASCSIRRARISGIMS